ncbi:Eukaryotic translation initiation factor 5 [Camellia lanceoleosa]|uniref:Eukaryotic translation initiation factor 5 n=1 Tax=Camellia lanceoleosa TaxID=1840588 RepID=A0ACC0H2C6_9ERIC|nr:Eukaryotic translation initiation factor 5 [Camellia lanceoleosa]
MLQVLMKVEQEQRVTKDAHRFAEQDAAAQRYAAQVLQMIQLRCAACGFVSNVDVRDKLTAFILKNPPGPKKGSKDKKEMQRAENEQLKEGEAADK